jgi:hypothetical protein
MSVNVLLPEVRKISMILFWTYLFTTNILYVLYKYTDPNFKTQ